VSVTYIATGRLILRNRADSESDAARRLCTPADRSLMSAYCKNGSMGLVATQPAASTPTEWAGREHPGSCHVRGVLLRE
jgi:hypothetical protein